MNHPFFQTIDQAPIFSQLSKAEKLRLCEVVEPKKFHENQVVFSCEQKGHCFFLVESGSVTLRLKNGKTRKYGPLESFGEIAIFNQSYRTGMIKANAATTLLTFHRSLLFPEGGLGAELSLKITHGLANNMVGYIMDNLITSCQKIIQKGENERVEFKASINPFTSEGIMRTLVAFLNAQGGTIFIGVDDYQRIVGVDAYSGKDIDRFCATLNDCIQRRIGPCFTQLISYDIEEVNGKRIFRIDCAPASKPAFLTIEGKGLSNDSKEIFLIRTGARNGAIKRKREMITYIEERFFAA